MLDLITVLMAGRIAEEIISGDISSGAAGDIQQATQMARAMVCTFGMSEKLGMVQYGEDNDYVFLGRDIVRSKDYSETTAREIDTEVKRICDESYERARKLIFEHRKELELIAAALLEYETLEGTQVEEIIKTGRLTNPPSKPQTGPPSGAEAVTPTEEAPQPVPPKLPPGLASPAPAPAS
jgi:cell division protease FtsH